MRAGIYLSPFAGNSGQPTTLASSEKLRQAAPLPQGEGIGVKSGWRHIPGMEYTVWKRYLISRSRIPHMPHRSHDGSQHPSADEQPGDQHTRDQAAYLTGERITPQRLTPDITVADLIDSSFQAYNAGRISEAARLYAQRMLDPEQDVTVCLTVAGAMTPAGVGGAIITLMERGAIDFMVSTGANLYHDMHYALDYALHRGSAKLSDPELHEAGIIRIYDILFRDEVLLDTDRFIRECLKTFPQRAMSTAELHHLL